MDNEKIFELRMFMENICYGNISLAQLKSNAEMFLEYLNSQSVTLPDVPEDFVKLFGLPYKKASDIHMAVCTGRIIQAIKILHAEAKGSLTLMNAKAEIQEYQRKYM